MPELFDTPFFQWQALIISATLAMILLLIRVPKTEYAKKLTKSKSTIAVNYLVSSAVFCYTLYNITDTLLYEEFSALTMLIVVAFSSIIISYSLINLLSQKDQDSGRYTLSIFVVAAASLILIESFFSGNTELHSITLYISIALFAIQSCFLIILFDKNYKKALELLEKYYDEDEEHKIKWIRFCYILTMLTDMFMLVYIFFPGKLLRMYIFFYILYMIYFAGNFISFIGSHKLLLDAVGHYAISEQSAIFNRKKRKSKENKENMKEEENGNFKELEIALNKWIKEKKYREYDKSREETAQELGTTKEILQMYFTEKVGMDFRSWRTELRINDAKALLLQKKEYSINFIGETVGFSDRSNFHRQFTRSVGCSPKEWRESDGHPVLSQDK